MDVNVIKVYFLLDNYVMGNESLYDTSTKDILYLNSSFSGRANRFGEKLYLWFKLSTYIHPNARYVGKLDDDVIFCLPHIYTNILQADRGSGLVYYGWQHNRNESHSYEWRTVKNSIQDYRMDEFFVVIGRKLIDRIIGRPYVACAPDICNSSNTLPQVSNTLYDWNFGGLSLGHWLSIYHDVRFHPVNHLFIHITAITRIHNYSERNSSFTYEQLKQPFCADHLAYHKAHHSEMMLFAKDLKSVPTP